MTIKFCQHLINRNLRVLIQSSASLLGASWCRVTVTDQKIKIPVHTEMLRLTLLLSYIKFMRSKLCVSHTASSNSLCAHLPPGVSLKLRYAVYFWCDQAKNHIITFQHIVIQPVWENTRLLHLSLALFSDRDRALFGQLHVISRNRCSYWLLCAALLRDMWHHCELFVETSDAPYDLKCPYVFLT